MSGLDIIRAIQSIANPFLDETMCFISEVWNSETTYMLLLAVLFWVYDKRFVRYAVSILLLGRWFNNILKWNIGAERPPADQVRVICAETAPDPAFPSGHSQLPMMVLGILALHFRKTWFTVSMAALIFLIGFSRLYLGVHWPIDVLGGWTIGALMLVGFELSRGYWNGEKLSYKAQLTFAILLPLAVLGVTFALPVFPHETWKLIGAWIGFSLGAVLEERFIGFDPRRATIPMQLVKVLVGVVCMLAVKEGLKLVLPTADASDLIRYIFVSGAATLLAPWIFSRFLPSGPAAGRSVAQ